MGNPIQQLISRIRSNPLVALIAFIATVVIGLSTFTNATKNLVALLPQQGNADVTGQWHAEVVYDWKNARYDETLMLRHDGKEVVGTVSFLGVPRAVLEGKLNRRELSFITRTPEAAGDQPARESIHRYHGFVDENTMHLEMQTQGGFSEHVPLMITAVRVRDSTK